MILIIDFHIIMKWTLKKMLVKQCPLLLKHFWPMFPFYTPWKQQKTKDFLVFSGDVKWEHWPEMGQWLQNCCKGLSRESSSSWNFLWEAWGQMGCKKKYTTHVRSIFHLKRNQLIHLQWKPIDRFLHEYNINLKWVNKIYKDFLTF